MLATKHELYYNAVMVGYFISLHENGVFLGQWDNRGIKLKVLLLNWMILRIGNLRA